MEPPRVGSIENDKLTKINKHINDKKKTNKKKTVIWTLKIDPLMNRTNQANWNDRLVGLNLMFNAPSTRINSTINVKTGIGS